MYHQDLAIYHYVRWRALDGDVVDERSDRLPGLGVLACYYGRQYAGDGALDQWLAAFVRGQQMVDSRGTTAEAMNMANNMLRETVDDSVSHIFHEAGRIRTPDVIPYYH